MMPPSCKAARGSASEFSYGKRPGQAWIPQGIWGWDKGAEKPQREKDSAGASPGAVLSPLCVICTKEIWGLINTPRPPAALRDLLASCAALAANPVWEHLELTRQALLRAAALVLIREFCTSCTQNSCRSKSNFHLRAQIGM